MAKNESDLDRAIRAGISVTALGTRLAIGGVFNPVGIALFGVAGMAGWTASSGHCPLYCTLGTSTHPQLQQD
jgi:Inner membrane protein YgaP-like, transmembrane domain